jgi:excisionase family DNA binding protein
MLSVSGPGGANPTRKAVPSAPQFSGKLYRVPEAADLLAVKPATIRKWILLRTIGVVHLSRRAVRVPASEITRIVSTGFVPAVEVGQ